MTRLKSVCAEVLISLGYGVGGSLGLWNLVQWMAMGLDNHLRFPYRSPFVITVGICTLIWCLCLLGWDLNRVSEWSRRQRIGVRVLVVVLTFLPLLALWDQLYELGDLLMGNEKW